jgi:hypothetical protein
LVGPKFPVIRPQGFGKPLGSTRQVYHLNIPGDKTSEVSKTFPKGNLWAEVSQLF